MNLSHNYFLGVTFYPFQKPLPSDNIPTEIYHQVMSIFTTNRSVPIGTL